TDMSTVDSFSAPWMLSIVMNRKGDILARIDINEPFRMAADHLRVSWNDPLDVATMDSIKSEVNQKLSKKTVTYVNRSGYGIQLPKSKKTSDIDDLYLGDDEAWWYGR